MPKTFLYVKDFFSATMDFVVLKTAESRRKKCVACRIREQYGRLSELELLGYHVIFASVAPATGKLGLIMLTAG